MKKILLTVFCLLNLAACTEMHNSTSRALDDVEDHTSASYNKMRGYMNMSRQDKTKPPRKVQQGYCYHAYQDIICYPEPLIGEDYRLVGFQEAAGDTQILPSTVIPSHSSKVITTTSSSTTTLSPLPVMLVQEPPVVTTTVVEPFGKPSKPVKKAKTVKKKKAKKKPAKATCPVCVEDIISGKTKATDTTTTVTTTTVTPSVITTVTPSVTTTVTPKQKLKEVQFDPEELQPKELVPPQTEQ